MERISVRVGERLKKELEAEARQKGVRPSDIVRIALEVYLRRRTPRESTGRDDFARDNGYHDRRWKLGGRRPHECIASGHAFTDRPDSRE